MRDDEEREDDFNVTIESSWAKATAIGYGYTRFSQPHNLAEVIEDALGMLFQGRHSPKTLCLLTALAGCEPFEIDPNDDIDRREHDRILNEAIRAARALQHAYIEIDHLEDRFDGPPIREMTILVRSPDHKTLQDSQPQSPSES